jgi:RNA polymerase sigma-70 factor (ECF subfamily)
LEYLSEHDLSRLAHGILEKMPENLRAVFRLVALEEMSGHDIANLLEIPVGTVRSRMRRARERMRRELGSSLADARKA